MNVFTALSPVAKEFQVLEILHANPSGLIAQEVVERTKNIISRSTVYTVLTRLEEKAFVTEELVKEPHRGPQRIRYRITQRGVAAHHAVRDSPELQSGLGLTPIAANRTENSDVPALSALQKGVAPVPAT